MLKKKFADNKKLKIVFMPTDRGGCGWYRVRNFYKEIESRGFADCLLLEADNSDDIENIGKAVEVADIVYFRPTSMKYVSAIRDIDKDKKIIFDHDDNTYLTDPSSDSYRSAGFEEVIVKGKDGKDQYMWKQGVDGFDMYRNQIAAISLQKALSQSNLVTSPNLRLAEEYGKFNGGSFAYVPNFIKFAQWDDINKQDTGEFRIGWSGGASHPMDFREVADELKDFMSEHKEVRLHLAGESWGFQWKEVEDQVVMHEWVEFQAHLFRMKCLNLDMAIIPLQDIPFNTYKSEVKYSEFSALKVPSIVKDIEPYNQFVKHGENGLLYQDAKSFRERLEWMYSDHRLREKLIKNAYQWVRDERDIDKHAERILNIWKTIL